MHINLPVHFLTKLVRFSMNHLLFVSFIGQVGYPVRKDFKDFEFRYKCMALDASDVPDLCTKLSAKGVLKEKQWAIGKSKVFLKNQQVSLEQ